MIVGVHTWDVFLPHIQRFIGSYGISHASIHKQKVARDQRLLNRCNNLVPFPQMMHCWIYKLSCHMLY